MKPALLKQCKAIKKWNDAYPLGQHVYYRRDLGQIVETVTRSRAELLNGHTAVIWLSGISGCVALERVSAKTSETILSS